MGLNSGGSVIVCGCVAVSPGSVGASRDVKDRALLKGPTRLKPSFLSFPSLNHPLASTTTSRHPPQFPLPRNLFFSHKQTITTVYRIEPSHSEPHDSPPLPAARVTPLRNGDCWPQPAYFR